MKIFVNPLLWFIIIQLVILVFLLCRDDKFKRLSVYLLLGLTFALTLFSLPITTDLLANSLTLTLEKPMTNKPDYIFTLGGGYHIGTSMEDDFLSEESYRRVQTATTLWKQYPHATLVVSGGSSEKGRQSKRLAQLMKQAAIQRGVPAAQILIEPHSFNTREHPIEALKLPNVNPDTPIVVVTSVWHLRRAKQEFNRYFKNAWYYSAPLKTDPITWKDFLPNSYTLGKSTVLLCEWVGLVWYRVIA